MAAARALALACSLAMSAAALPPETCFSEGGAAAGDAGFLCCLFCATPRFSTFATPRGWCDAERAGDGAAVVAAALLRYAEKIHGVYWRNDTSAGSALTHLVSS